MKKTLLCIFLMLAGAAVIAGAILLSLGRYEYFDASPACTLVFLSIVTIAAAAFHIKSPDAPEVSEREKAILRAFRAVSVLAILADLVFIVIMFFLTRYYDHGLFRHLHNVLPLMVLAIVGVAAAALNLKGRPPFIGRDIAKAAAALVITAALCFVYINYMPKYSHDDGLNILLSDKEFAQKDIVGSDETTSRDFGYTELFGGNPFYNDLYAYHCDSFGYDAGGLHITKGCILFNPATGAYEYMHTEDQDKTYSPGDWPEFNYYFLQDKDGQHNTAINLYFREWWWGPWGGPIEVSAMNFYFSGGNDELGAKLKDAKYPHNFPEDEARAFLRSMGEERLKAKLLELIKGNQTVEVYFFGIDIATYRNGEITLKI